MSEPSSPLAHFSGTARLFPLPNLVLFPEVVAPLHIFEPRYRQMTRDALAGDRLIALAILLPGFEADYEKSPPIFSVVCVAHIETEQELDDGRFNLLVRGVARARIVEEIASGKLYRQAQVQMLEDIPLLDVGQESALRQRFLKLVPTWLAGPEAIVEQFDKLLNSDIALGLLCDILTFALPFPTEFKQQQLAELHVQQRASALLERLQQKKEKTFPPEFSEN
jgi:Lon protease-like protein